MDAASYLYRAAAALVCATFLTASQAVADPPYCGEPKPMMPPGVTLEMALYDAKSASVSLTVPIPIHSANLEGISLSDGSITIDLYWPDPNLGSARVSLPPLRADQPPRGEVQLVCGNRNMGLINFKLSEGNPSLESPDRDVADCIEELDRDGRFELTLVQNGSSRIIARGQVALRTARSQAIQFVESELARGAAGRCEFEPLEIVVT